MKLMKLMKPIPFSTWLVRKWCQVGLKVWFGGGNPIIPYQLALLKMSLRYPKVWYFLNSIWRMFFLIFVPQILVGFSKLPASIHLNPSERNEICKMPTALRWYDWCGLMQVWLRLAWCHVLKRKRVMKRVQYLRLAMLSCFPANCY